MSKNVVISIENLSKCYLVGHQGSKEGYSSLRETVVRHGRNFARKTIDMARGRQIVQGDEVEEFWALKDVTFEVKRGEVIGIIGRNGAGKSTLLKILSRITEPTSGRVVLNGRVASLLEVGTGFHPELTGRENIYLNGAILGMTKAEIRRKFDEIVEFSGVENFLDTPVKRYSSGMYVRLAFSVAAHLEPEILIVDEVLAVGDAEFQKRCFKRMQTLSSKEGRTILLVSHNLPSIEALATNCVWLAEGRLKFEGETLDVCSQYARDETQEGDDEGVIRDKHPDIFFTEFSWDDNSLKGVPGNAISGFSFKICWNSSIDQRIVLDFALHDQRGEMVAHMQGEDLGWSSSLPSNSQCRFNVSLRLPFLAPGNYKLTIFGYDNQTGDKKQMIWIDAIPGLRVTASNHFGPTPMLRPSRGAVIPPFSVNQQFID